MGEEGQLVEGEDFYREGAMIVLTARFHLRRGYCCACGCRHCPYRMPAAPPRETDEEDEENNATCRTKT